jgi:NADH-ubiquinone oxidoreductase chain 1
MIISSLISVLEVVLVTVPTLLAVAFVTVAERKTMASMQRRLGPNLIGYYGLLQAFADALKLLLKEYVAPTQANFILFFLGPIVTLIFSLLSFAVIPYGSGLTILDLDLGILYLLAVSSIATYGILLAGWSANSKYAFLGSLRSTAQLISYELILSSAILIIILLTGSLNLTSNLEAQKAVWFLFPLFPIFLVFFIACIAETNRAPFDLAEAESELVSGFMTEHAAVIFVFFFLAEYSSIVLICILTSILFLGGYLINLTPLIYLFSITYGLFEAFTLLIMFLFIDIYSILSTILEYSIEYFIYILSVFNPMQTTLSDMLLNIQNNCEVYRNTLSFEKDNILSTLRLIVTNFPDTDFVVLPNLIIGNTSSGIISAVILGIKTSLMVFVFIWARASFPRIRFDQLMSFCWTVLLPIVVAFIILVPCILYAFDLLPNNIILL